MQFSEAHRWNPGSFTNPEWGWRDEVIRPFRDVLVPTSVPCRASEHADGHPPLVTIRFDGSIERRDADPTSIKDRLFLARASDLVYSKIDVRNGAIGVVPPELPLIAVTSEYPVHRVRGERADVAYVRLVVRSSAMRREIQSRISGASGRKRIMPADLLDIHAPFPTLATQRVIVEHAHRSVAALSEKQEAAARVIDEASVAFLHALGLKAPEETPRRQIMIRKWSNTDRWGVDYNQRVDSGGASVDGAYPTVRLGDVIADLENGWSPQCLKRPAEVGEWGVLKLGAVSFGQYNDNENKALPKHLSPIPRYEVRPGDVLISRANIPRLVGACALVVETQERLILCDKIFRVVPKEKPEILGAFIAEVLKIPQVRFQIESACTGTSPTMQNITKPALLDLRFPLPTLDVQERLVGMITDARTRADAMRADAQQRHDQAMQEVDAMILGTMPVPKV